MVSEIPNFTLYHVRKLILKLILIPLLKAGNMRFRDAIENSVDPFMRATLKEEKAAIVQSVIDKVTSVGGRFLRHDFHKKKVRNFFVKRTCFSLNFCLCGL